MDKMKKISHQAINNQTITNKQIIKIEEWMNCLRKITSLSPRFYLILHYTTYWDATSYDDDEAVVYNGKDGNYDVGDNDNNK